MYRLAERRDPARATATGSGQIGVAVPPPRAEKDFFDVKESGRKLDWPAILLHATCDFCHAKGYGGVADEPIGKTHRSHHRPRKR